MGKKAKKAKKAVKKAKKLLKKGKKISHKKAKKIVKKAKKAAKKAKKAVKKAKAACKAPPKSGDKYGDNLLKYGTWGGLCTCPSGGKYWVSDRNNSCKSTGCNGGKMVGCKD